MSWRGWAGRVRGSVFSGAEYISAAFVLIVTAMVMLRILNRFVDVPLTGFAEYAQTMVLWIIFLGIGRAAYERDDIRSDWVLEKLPERAESALRGLIVVMNTGTVAVLLAAAVLVLLEFQGRATPAAGIPFPLLHGALVVGSFLLLAVYVTFLAKGARSIVGEIT